MILYTVGYDVCANRSTIDKNTILQYLFVVCTSYTNKGTPVSIYICKDLLYGVLIYQRHYYFGTACVYVFVGTVVVHLLLVFVLSFFEVPLQPGR